MSSEFFLSMCSNVRKGLDGGGRTYVEFVLGLKFSPQHQSKEKRNWELTLYPMQFGRHSVRFQAYV